MAVILGLASSMSFLLVMYADRKRKVEINTIPTIYIIRKSLKEKNILVGNASKLLGRIQMRHLPKKVGTHPN
jgi:ribosomal protein L11